MKIRSSKLKLREAVRFVGGRVLCGHDLLDMEVEGACAADLLSDVLAFTEEGDTLLITGTTSVQVLRVATILHIPAIVFVRGKEPPASVVEAAEKVGIALVTTPRTMFAVCGLLFARGMRCSPMKPSQKMSTGDD
ncbi:MAG: DRTGG domain-containing protein [Candidatus Bipolaricaulota bacterium]|nr:DRTGG domain-containing protein [Candidatus Bipolaricaulota bacterium]